MVFADIPVAHIEEANQKIFADDSSYATDYQWKQSQLEAVWFRGLARKFTRLLGPARVLDIGCGNGQLLAHFKALGWECVGLDPSPWSRRYAELGNFELLNGYPEDFQDRSEDFSLVVSTSTLEHVAEPRGHVRSILNFVRPRGYAYFCGIPNYGSWAIRMNASSFFANKPPMHVNYFTPKSLARLLEGAALASYRIRTYGIPEIHRLLYRHRRARRPRETPTPAACSRAGPSRVRAMQKARHEIAVRGYYWAGVPFWLGDKLELTISR